jgi:hypothetical protein
MALAEIGEAGEEPADGEGSDGAERQDLAHVAGLEALQHVGHAVEAVLQRREERQALLGDHQPARQAAEERDPEPLFQELHLVADGGLGDAEFDRRAREGQVSGSGFEGAQRVQRKVWPDHRMP